MEELASLGWRHFLIGLCATWVVGIGRHWDHDRAEFFQRMGMGSIAYVFPLSAAFWFLQGHWQTGHGPIEICSFS